MFKRVVFIFTMSISCGAYHMGRDFDDPEMVAIFNQERRELLVRSLRPVSPHNELVTPLGMMRSYFDQMIAFRKLHESQKKEE